MTANRQCMMMSTPLLPLPLLLLNVVVAQQYDIFLIGVLYQILKRLIANTVEDPSPNRTINNHKLPHLQT